MWDYRKRSLDGIQIKLPSFCRLLRVKFCYYAISLGNDSDENTCPVEINCFLNYFPLNSANEPAHYTQKLFPNSLIASKKCQIDWMLHSAQSVLCIESGFFLTIHEFSKLKTATFSGSSHFFPPIFGDCPQLHTRRLLLCLGNQLFIALCRLFLI